MSRERAFLKSALCTQEQLESDVFTGWAERLRPAWDHGKSGKKVLLHRKLWEWLFAVQALHERGLLAPGKRGLGFGVGREPLAALFASFGCEIVATDLDPERAHQAGWVGTHQHASALDHLNEYGLCDPAVFAKNVSYRSVDMNHIPAELGGFDFTWSSCAFEHLGSVVHGQEFLLEQMKCLKPGGFGVHTTEFNLSSNTKTVDFFHTVLFRRRDIDWLVEELRKDNHLVELDLDPGTGLADGHIDAPPYSEVHLRVRLEEFVTTSIGLIVRKNPFAAGAPAKRPAQRKLRLRAAEAQIAARKNLKNGTELARKVAGKVRSRLP